MHVTIGEYKFQVDDDDGIASAVEAMAVARLESALVLGVGPDGFEVALGYLQHDGSITEGPT